MILYIISYYETYCKVFYRGFHPLGKPSGFRHYIYNSTLVALSDRYYIQIDLMRDLVSYKTNWRDYTADEKLIVENTVLLVGAIYAMCKVQLVVNSEEETELNIKVINKKEASKARKRGKELLEQLA